MPDDEPHAPRAPRAPREPRASRAPRASRSPRESRSPGESRSRSRVIVTVAVVIALVVAGVVVYRVLAPAEVVTVTATAYPAPAQARPGVIGSLAAAPLIVDGRVRVYATTRQVRADGPVDARTQRSPIWSFRRWPQQLVGVVAVGRTVVSQWSDGLLVAIDASTGRVAWRASGPEPETARYTGRRTGAETVYTPQGLFTATATATATAAVTAGLGGAGVGRAVVLVGGVSALYAFDAATGRELWRTFFEGRLPNCRAGGFTTTGGRFVTLDACEVPQALEFYDVATGRREARWRPPGAGMSLGAFPLSCVVERSECAAMRVQTDGDEQGWLLDRPQPVRAAALDPPTAWLVDGVVVDIPERSDAVTGRSARGGPPLWTRPADSATVGDRPDSAGGRTEVVAAQPGAVHLLTEDRWLITLDPATGVELSRFDLRYHREPASLEWRPGHAYGRHRFLLIERLVPDAAPGLSDDEYYAIDQPVLLVGT